MNTIDRWKQVKNDIPKEVDLVAVSKTHPVEKIQLLYDQGQRKFGENKVQELLSKAEVLPKDISWHLIGHLQRNKAADAVKTADVIESVDSERLLKEIDKEAGKINKVQNILLQVKIAQEESKFGLEIEELVKIMDQIASGNYPNVHLLGFMGMASFTDDQNQLKSEFNSLKKLFDQYKDNFKLTTLSMGMSGDYLLAISGGSTSVRVGSAIFGERDYQ